MLDNTDCLFKLHSGQILLNQVLCHRKVAFKSATDKLCLTKSRSKNKYYNVMVRTRKNATTFLVPAVSSKMIFMQLGQLQSNPVA